MSSSWVPDLNPIELDDGSLICRAHHLVICGICCCDYSFMQDLEEDEDSDSRARPGEDSEDSEDFFYSTLTDIISASHASGGFREPLESEPIPAITKFVPPCSTDTPSMLFQPADRFIRRTNPHEILIYTDGACLSNGLANPRGGCGFIISPTHKVRFRLENEGPTNEVYAQTSNRAELRAVIAALEYRYWPGDYMASWHRLVIATDSEYVVLGATERIRNWISRGWRTSSGEPVKNQDLWKRLIHRIKEMHIPQTFSQPHHGTAVSFWRIPRQWNGEADTEAKRGAELAEEQEFRKLIGTAC